MSMWKRAMDYLGLGPDDAYDEYDDVTDDRQRPRLIQPRLVRERLDVDLVFDAQFIYAFECFHRFSSGRSRFPAR